MTCGMAITSDKERNRLYDLEADIAEQHDLANHYPDVVERCSKYFDIADIAKQ
jgi:hypothetical protein